MTVDTPNQSIQTNQYVTIEKQDGVGIIWMDQQDSPVNKLSPDVINAYRDIMQQVEEDNDIKAVVLISKKKDFIAGADIDALQAMTQPGEWMKVAQKGHALLNRIEQSAKPVVAAIHGTAAGGGCEVALACHYRIASDDKSTVFSQPEVQLGLLPGGGGTQRLTELVGIQQSLDMMLTGRKIYARKAKKIGLVDRIVAPTALLRAAKQQALSLIDKPFKRKDARSFKDRILEGNRFTQNIIFKEARKKVLRQTKGNYPAPIKIIECVEEGIKHGRDRGFAAEIIKFDELVISPVSKQLINIFFAMTAKKKNPMADLVKPVNKIGMLGAGFMGAGIAEISAKNGIDVALKDIKAETLASAKKTVWNNLSRRVKKKAMTSFEREGIMNHISTHLDYDGFQHVDMVIEAVFEDLSLKQRVIKECEAATKDDCIFASNTSALPISKIAAVANRPELVIGMHYFSPVPKMPLLEIVVTDQTADWVTATTLQVGIQQGKTCIVVKDGPGFYTTRILAPLMGEALLLLEEGGDILQIDEAAKQLGFPVGPITLMDEVGIDVGAHIMTGELMEFFRSRGEFKSSNAIMEMAKAGYHGRKNKKGFYQYDAKTGKKKRGKVDEYVYDFFGGNAKNRQKMDINFIKDRLLFIMTNEAAECLHDGTLQNPTDGDVGAIFGLGYPPFTGGPFRYLDSVGCDKALDTLERLARQCGARFTASEIIRTYAAEGKKFHN